MAKRALGRGLSALIPIRVLEDAPEGGPGPREVSPDAIQPNPFQPRHEIKDETIAVLAASVRENGILEPLLVRRHGDGYQLIAGERRLRAAQKAGLRQVPVVVRSANDSQMLLLALIENLQREDLNPMEEALAYRELTDQFRVGPDALAKHVGRDRSTVANTLRLLHLPEEVQRMVRQGVLSAGHARAVLQIPSPEEQKALARLIVRENLSVREAEDLARQKRPAGAPARKRMKPRGGKADPQLLSIEEELQRLWGTKVKIKTNSRGSGTLTVSFFSHDDLDRILDLLKGRR